VFGCPLVGVADTPPERVRAFFGVNGPAPRCKIGWIRVPGGAVLDIIHFEPQQPPVAVPWYRVGKTHFSFNVRNTDLRHAASAGAARVVTAAPCGGDQPRGSQPGAGRR
jgi:hypothetical protein